jgi:hypothetical protein
LDQWTLLVAYTLIQSQGRPDVTGKPAFCRTAAVSGHTLGSDRSFGINGAAAACATLHRGRIGDVLGRPDFPAKSSRPRWRSRPRFFSAAKSRAGFSDRALSLSLVAALLAGLTALGLAYAYSGDLRQILTVQIVRARSFGEALIPRLKPARSA